MRELTWAEKIIDSQYDNAISKWGKAFEELLGNLTKIDHLYRITLKRGEKYTVNIINLDEDHPDFVTHHIEYEITYDLPKLVDKPRKVFRQILEENGFQNYIFPLTEERLSIIVVEWI